MHVLGYEFFEAVVSSFGRLVCMNDYTRDKSHLGVARVFVEVQEPFLSGKEVACRYME